MRKISMQLLSVEAVGLIYWSTMGNSVHLRVRQLKEEQIPEWATALTRVLDEAIRIPGTEIRIGLDSILGFVAPVLGDALAGTLSIGLLILAFYRRVPVVVILRMLLNIVIDVIIGSIPLVGDAFDVVWRSNRKNLELISRYQQTGNDKAHFEDYLVIGFAIAITLCAVAVPVVGFLWIANQIGKSF